MEIEFTVEGHPWEKGNPVPFIIWPQTKDGDKGKTFASQRYESEPLKRWTVQVLESARKAMYHKPGLFKGYVGIYAVFYVPRPHSHYKEDGTVRTSYFDSLPAAKSSGLVLLQRAIIEALPDVVIFNVNQVVKQSSMKLFRETGGATINIFSVTKPALDGSPEQLDLEFE